MASKVTEEDFIRRAKQKHGTLYDYSKVEYKNTITKVEIGCKKCETAFLMTPESHMIGQGCRACGYARNGKAKQTSFDKFVEESHTVHNNKYDYSDVIWKGSKQSITLYCPVHQEDFVTTPYNHVKGAECPHCAKIRGGLKNRSNTESFVKASKDKFGEKFDYSETVYVRSNTKVKIRCVKHDHTWEITPNSHLMNGGNCPVCVSEGISERNRKSAEDFLAHSLQTHGNRYGYDRAVYVEAGAKVEIYCREHGYFWQCPSRHAHGAGCPMCGNHGYKTSKAGCLYVLSDGKLTKVGITNKDPRVRSNFISKDSGRTFKVLRAYYFDDGHIPYKIETALLSELWKQYESPTEKFSGYTECFYRVDLEALISRIETLIQEHSDAHNKQ